MVLLRAIALTLCLALPQVAVADCTPRDFLTLPLPTGDDPAETALLLAYPGLTVAKGTVTLPDGTALPMGDDADRPPALRLTDANLREMFHDIYPLTDLPAAREVPWFDPGRARHQPFFLAMYGASKAEVRSRLVRISGIAPGMPEFQLTRSQGVACQFEAALHDIAALSDDWRPAFKDAAGSFLWRKIAGTDRLSAHSFGIAFDLNAQLGGYWRWSGRPEGDAGAYENHIPMAVVAAFERRGFIWGGKWHHFDGMHFEYRPEILLYARLRGG